MAAIAAVAMSCLVPSHAMARAKPTPTPSPSPSPVADPAVTKLVRQQFVAWQAGNVNKSLYSPQIQSQLTDAKIADVSQKLGFLGALTATVYVGPYYSADFPQGAQGYIYQMLCREANVYVFAVIDAQGKIANFYFKDRLVTETIEVPASGAPAPSPTAPRLTP